MSKIPAPGDRIGDRYRVTKLIGEGGMGTVFEAENLVTHKRVALKWLHPAIANRTESAQRLVREAQAASRVRHPNVVDVYDVITCDGTIFLVLELLEGEALYEVLERGGMKMPEFIGLLIQAMRGVSAAHQQGVIHRDVHPGNIFLERSHDRGGVVVKVLDFGISKLDGEATHALTQSGTTMGTPLYMSYEQLCATRDLDARADIYSFGVILYRALTGRYPFSAESLTELAVQFATTKPATVKALRPEIPSALDRLVMACVARERDLRPQSVDALIDELEPFAAEDSFRALLSGRSREVPLVLATQPVTKLHADGASLIPPTAQQMPLSPAPYVPASAQAPRSPVPAAPMSTPHFASEPPREPVAPPAAVRASGWRAPVLVGLAVLLLGGIGAALLLPRMGGDASAPTSLPPSLPERASVTLQDPSSVAEHAAPATGATIPPGVAPPSTPPAQATKPARVWLPRPKPPVPPPPAPPGEQPYYRVGRPPSADDFK